MGRAGRLDPFAGAEPEQQRVGLYRSDLSDSDPVYEGIKVPVEFYKVVAMVDDAKGQLSLTAFEMDQSSVMPPPVHTSIHYSQSLEST
jgi:hypothetical protein